MLRRKGSRPEAENALMVGDFPARTDDARSARASDVEDATVQRARRRVWRLVHEQMNGRDALGSTAAKPRSQGERKRERILIDQANMLVRRYLCTVFFWAEIEIVRQSVVSFFWNEEAIRTL